MSGDARSYPRLHEEHVPRKGYVLLIPWMLLGALWLKLSTGINQSDLTFYFGLLVAGAISLGFLIQNEPRINNELARLKLLPFIWAYGLAMTGVIMVVTAIKLLTAGTVHFNQFQSIAFINFLALTCLIVAPVETIVFQFVIPKLSTMSLRTMDTKTRKGSFQMWMLGGVAAQSTFAGFHYAAENHNLGSLVIIFALGLGIYALVLSSPVWGLGAGMGAHAGYNIILASTDPTQINIVLGHITNALPHILACCLQNMGNVNAMLGGIL